MGFRCLWSLGIFLWSWWSLNFRDGKLIFFLNIWGECEDLWWCMMWFLVFLFCCLFFLLNRWVYVWEDFLIFGFEFVVDCWGGLVVCIRVWGYWIVWWIVFGFYFVLLCFELKLVWWYWRFFLVDVIVNIVVLYLIFKFCFIMKLLILWCILFIIFVIFLFLIIVLYNFYIIKIFW